MVPDLARDRPRDSLFFFVELVACHVRAVPWMTWNTTIRSHSNTGCPKSLATGWFSMSSHAEIRYKIEVSVGMEISVSFVMVFNWMPWNMGPLICHTHMSYTSILLVVLAPTPPRIAALETAADLATSHSAWCRGAIQWVHHKGVDGWWYRWWLQKHLGYKNHQNPTTVSKPNLVATTGCFAITSTVCDDKKLQEAEDVSHVLFFRKQVEQIIWHLIHWDQYTGLLKKPYVIFWSMSSLKSHWRKWSLRT